MRVAPGRKSPEHKKLRKELKQAAFFIAQRNVQIAREAGDDDAEINMLVANDDAKDAYIAVKRREARLAAEGGAARGERVDAVPERQQAAVDVGALVQRLPAVA